MYSIKAITTLTGLTAETLRAWERRYDCISPIRSGNGRRSYSQDDLEKLKLLVELTRNGHAISKIAHLDTTELRRFQQQSSDGQSDHHAAIFAQIIEAVQQYKIERCEQLLKRAMMANEPLDYAREILLPALHQIGQLWHDEKINIAQEHIFSACVNRIVLAMVNNLHQPSKHNPAMLFATPSGEPHEFGILLSCLIAASLQYTCYYLGADLPANDILDASAHLKPEVIVMGLVKTPPDEQTLGQLEKVIALNDLAACKIWLGGFGAEYWYPNGALLAEKCELITDVDHFHAKAQQLRLFGRGS